MVEMMVDANQGTIFPYHTTGPRWFDNIARLSAEVDIPIAGGEANAGMHEFKLLIERRCYDILQSTTREPT